MGKDVVLSIRGVFHAFGEHQVLHDVNLDVERGSIVGIVGPSGCGKSTLFRAIVGTHPPQDGVLVVHTGEGTARPVRGPGRDRGIVYQRYSLFPFLTALDNVAIAPTLDQTSIPYRIFRPFAWRRLRKKYREEARAMLEKVGLGDSIHRYPSELSGGMCQRVAIAQALIMKPEILLLDEPFGALDEATREELQRMLLTLNVENLEARKKGLRPPYTILIVTHELNEAIYVGDRVIGLSQYWNWKEKGFTRSPGATIVYDNCSPVYLPDQERDLEAFAQQREEIRHVVFDPDVKQEAALYRRYHSAAV